MSYHTYIDWTLESPARPFYVGKGTDRRVEDLARNIVHCRIVEKHGIRREVVLTTDVEQEAFDCEVRLIQEHKTYVHGGDGWWGANLTLGGDGASGYHHTEEHKKHISEVLTGRIFSEEHKRNLTRAHTGRKHTDETKRKCREAAKLRKPTVHEPGCTCGMHFAGIKRRVLSDADVVQMHTMHASGMTWKQIAIQRQVSNSTIQRAAKRYDQTRLDSTS